MDAKICDKINGCVYANSSCGISLLTSGQYVHVVGIILVARKLYFRIQRNHQSSYRTRKASMQTIVGPRLFLLFWAHALV